MKLNRKWLMVIALVMSLTMVTAGTLAYLTDRDTEVNVFTMGDVDIELDEKFEQDSELIPGVDIEKEAIIKNVGKNDAWVWLSVLLPYEMGPYTAPENMSASNNVVHWNFPAENGSKMTIKFNKTPVEVDTDGDGVAEKYYQTVMLWNEILEAGDATDIMMNKVYMDKHVDITPEGDLYWVEGGETTDLNWNINDNGNPKIIVSAYAIQTEGFETAEEAYNAYTEQWGGLNLGTLEDDSNHICWNGTSDTSWYNETDTEFVLTTPEQLAGLAELVDGGNTFAGKTIKLGNDICLECYAEDGEQLSFNPIGYGYNTVFKGTFDGQDHKIENLYQNGWELGYDYSTEGGGLFASVVDATIKDLTIDNAKIVMECIDMGVLVGYSYGDCSYENITVQNSSIANYQRYTGGVVGEVNGTQTFKNVDVKDTVISSLWGDFDCSLGGLIGGKYGDANITLEDCDVECEINAYNDVTSSYQWYAYRRAGMLIGNSEETQEVNGTTYASAPYLTATNCTVTYGDWADYTYCEFAGQNWPYVRVQGSTVGQCSAYSNPRYGVATDANGNKVIDDNHVHNEGEDHNVRLTFDQLYGGGQGVYGTATHSGITVNYPN